jgi:N utilization substance protein B
MPKPSPRRDGREAAIQYLFGHETPGESETDEEIFELFWKLRDCKPKARAFAEELIAGVRIHQEAIDESITGALVNFKFARLTQVDRNILRLGAFEICFADYIPPQAALNEAIEIAKRFGTEDSPKFINGVLDRILKENSTKDT